jgi:hypothetical protein
MAKVLMSFFQYSNTPILHHSASGSAGTFDKSRFTFLLIIVPNYFDNSLLCEEKNFLRP